MSPRPHPTLLIAVVVIFLAMCWYALWIQK